MDKKLLGLISVFFLSFLIFISVLLFNKPIVQLLRAKEETNPSPKKSLIIAWPLTLPADGKTNSTITVFLRNEKNQPVSNKIIFLKSTLGEFKENNLISDKDGKAEFHLSSTTPGLAQITVNAAGFELIQKLSIKFE
ncbi:MAG: Ig-like domain-containing protein [Patescibacteria group bacterium]|nr:Ig-like domain-containing protein [Patescibacteria group bacterium]